MLTNNTTHTAGDDGSFLTLPSVEQHVVSVVLCLFFLMGFVGNSGILVIIRGFKPSVSLCFRLRVIIDSLFSFQIRTATSIVTYPNFLIFPQHQYRPGRLLLIWMFAVDLGLTILMVFPATLTSFGWDGKE